MSTICLIAPVVTSENKAKLLPRLIDKSQEEVELVVAHYKPAQVWEPRERMKPVVVRKAACDSHRLGLPLFSKESEMFANWESRRSDR